MRTLTSQERQVVGGSGVAMDAAEGIAAGAIGIMAGVVASAFLTPAGGILVGEGVGDLAGLAFLGINYLLE